MSGPFTIAEAKEKNAVGIATGGCWRCIWLSKNQGANNKTQWEMKDLKFIGHRNFCKKHYREEIQGATDF